MDFRKLGIEKAFANLLKNDFADAEKQYLRLHTEIKGNEYVTIKRSKQPAKYAFPEEQQKAIDKFIAENGFKQIEVEPEKPDYKIELVATPKAEREVKRILKLASINGNRTLSISAKRVLKLK